MKNTRDYYLGNPNLPTENTEFEWSPKMIKELKKASKIFFTSLKISSS